MQELLAAPSSGGSSGGRGGAPASNDLEARLYAADLHGCLIRVAHTAGACGAPGQLAAELEALLLPVAAPARAGPLLAKLQLPSLAMTLPSHLPSSACPADPQYRRVRGVVVRDTANTLHLVTPDSRLLLVPKAVRWRLGVS